MWVGIGGRQKRAQHLFSNSQSTLPSSTAILASKSFSVFYRLLFFICVKWSSQDLYKLCNELKIHWTEIQYYTIQRNSWDFSVLIHGFHIASIHNKWTLSPHWTNAEEVAFLLYSFRVKKGCFPLYFKVLSGQYLCWWILLQCVAWK